MSKRFRLCNLNEPLLLPPSLQDWLPEDHLARFIADLVEHLNLERILADYEDPRGLAAYHPKMMVRLLLYGYCTGVRSSRKIEEKTHDDIAFRYLAANQHPDHDTIATFRRRHLQAFAELFNQALRMCDKVGLIKLGHVAIDGTKLKANASKHKAMSYERMNEKEKQLREQVEQLLAEAAKADADEDAKYGPGKRIDELPKELARRESRLKNIAGAKAELEQEAKEQAEAEKAAVEAKLEERRKKEQEQGRKMGGGAPQVPDPEQAKPKPKAQRNFTDKDSRIMKDGATKEFIQGYNAQAAVDSAAQIIVAAEITQQANDKQQLVPMVQAVEKNLGKKPEHVTADSGYFSEKAVTDEAVEGVDLLVAVSREKHGSGTEQGGEAAEKNHGQKPGDETADAGSYSAEAVNDAAVNGADPRVAVRGGKPGSGTEQGGKAAEQKPAKVPSAAETMRKKLNSADGKAIYKMRKAVVEPVFGQIKERRGLRSFLLRGLEKVSAEWKIICLTHNILKMFVAGVRQQTV